MDVPPILPASPFEAAWIKAKWHGRIREEDPPVAEVWGRRLEGKCWVWTGWSDGKGHGKVRIEGRAVYLHRYSWEQFNCVEIPPGHDGDHLCRNRPCFNPTHIEPVPSLENYRRGRGPSTSYRRAEEYRSDGDSHLSQEDIDALAGGF